MYIRKNTLIITLLVIALLFTSIGVYAEPTIQEIKALISYETKMLLNGKDFNPVDTNGRALRPIIYNNTTYLPVRAICDAVGLAVDYDAKAKTVIMGERKDYVPVTADILSTYMDMAFTKDLDLLYTPSKTYNWGLLNLYEHSSVYGDSGSLSLKKKYTKLNTSVYLTESAKYPVNIEFRQDDQYKGEVKKLVQLNPGESADIEIDVTGVSDLWISYTLKQNGKVIFGEPKLK